MQHTHTEARRTAAAAGSITIDQLADNLVREPSGIWSARSETAVSYPDEGNARCLALEEHSFWFRHRNDCILAAMTLHPPGGVVFDIGGGNGFVASAIQSAGREVVLVEPGPAGAVNARARGLEHVICATLESAAFRSHVIPAAGLFDVLEHIADDGAFLRRLRELLIPRGRLYITVPAYRLLWSVEDDYAGHFRRYRQRSLVSTLERSGFTIDFATYIFALLPVPILLTRALPSRLGLRRDVSLATERREHDPGGGPVRALLEWTLRRELHALRAGRVIRCGGSCLVVASAA
jgi:SAM-dependent methyltransferase